MTEQHKFEAWADAKFGRAVIPQHERYASLFEAWQARASQDRSAELLEELDRIAGCTTDAMTGALIQAAISKARVE